MDHPRPIVGVVGAGQLARMCWQAAIGLDVDLRVLAARRDDAAAAVLPCPDVGDPGDAGALRAFADRCDVLTFDHELVDSAALAALEADGHVVRPAAAALRFAQDKAFQRRRFAAAGLPVPAHAVVPDADTVRAFAGDHGWPVVLKRPHGGYDGRGVWHVADAAALDIVWPQASPDAAPLLVEQAVAIDREVAVLVARRPGGQQAAAPLIETVQTDGMLRELVVPARVPAAVAAVAQDLAERVVDLVGVVGVCAVEMFVVQRSRSAGRFSEPGSAEFRSGDDVLLNEIAARPHNSGHWTIDAAGTSQFENHLRAVLDLPLGAMRATSPAVCTVNVVGTDDSWPQTRLADALRDEDVHVHLYGKQPRAGRKLGHVTAAGDDLDSVRERAHRAADALSARAPAAAPAR